MSAFFQSSGVSADCCDLSKIVENHLAVTSDSSFDTCVCMPSHTTDPAMSKWVTSGLTLFFNCGYCFTLQTLLGGTWEAGEQALPVKTKANWVPQPFFYCFSQGPTDSGPTQPSFCYRCTYRSLSCCPSHPLLVSTWALFFPTPHIPGLIFLPSSLSLLPALCVSFLVLWGGLVSSPEPLRPQGQFLMGFCQTTSETKIHSSEFRVAILLLILLASFLLFILHEK